MASEPFLQKREEVSNADQQANSDNQVQDHVAGVLEQLNSFILLRVLVVALLCEVPHEQGNAEKQEEAEDCQHPESVSLQSLYLS